MLALFSAVWKPCIGLIILVLINIAMGSADAIISGEFDRKILRKGSLKGMIVSVCVIMAYIAGYLNTDISFTLNGATTTLLSAMTLLIAAAYIYYAQSVLKNLALIFSVDISTIKDSSTDETENTTSDTVEVVAENSASVADTSEPAVETVETPASSG